RVAPDNVRVHLTGKGKLRREGGFWVAELPGGANARLFISRADMRTVVGPAKDASLDLASLTPGGPPRWPQELTTTVKHGKDNGPFAADTLTPPESNPWQSWMRPGGFDFLPDGKSAILCTWNGDVWRVDGLTANPAETLQWRRIACGL